MCRLRLFVLHLEGALVLRDEGCEAVVRELFVALLLLRAELLQHRALALARLEVPGVAGQLNPLVLLVLVRLDERRPLDHTAELLPVRGLEENGGRKKK